MSQIAIITARGGSKRIPKKNIKEFLGKPIITYSIESALNSQIYDRVMVSTDSEEIKEVALKYGAEVPFMRSEKTSNDFATTRDVLVEVIEEYKNIGIEFDSFTCIYPTAPFITSKILIEANEKFKIGAYNALMPVVKFSFPIQRSLKIIDGYLKPFDEKSYLKRSQDLEQMYHDCGQFYFYRTEEFLKSNGILLTKTIPFEIDEMFVQDIDNLDDWKIAEMKYKIINNIKNEFLNL